MLKNMREKRSNKSKSNFSQNQISPDKYKSSPRKKTSPYNNFDNTNYGNLNYNINTNHNIMGSNNDINMNEDNKQFFIDQNNNNFNINSRNIKDNYNNFYKTYDDNIIDNESYRKNQSERKVLFNNLKIGKFKIYYPSKKKKKIITNFNFLIKSKKKSVKKIIYKIESNSLNINSQIRNNNGNNIKKNNKNFTGIKIIEIKKGKEISITEFNSSNKLFKEEIKQKKIYLNENEYKLIDVDSLKNEKEKAIEDAFKIKENLLFNDNEKKNLENKKEEESIEISLENTSSKKKLSNKKGNKKDDKIEDKKNEFENEKNNIENYYKKLIEDSLKEQEIKFNQIKEEEIKKLINELNIKHENEMKNALEQQKKVYEEKIKKISNEKEKARIKNENLKIQNTQFEIQDSYTSIFKMAKSNFNPDVIGIINKKPSINYKKIKPTFTIFNDSIDENIFSKTIDNSNFYQNKKELRMKLKSKKK